MQHLPQQHADDGHDGERAEGTSEDQWLGLLKRQQQRNEEGLVANLAARVGVRGVRGLR